VQNPAHPEQSFTITVSEGMGRLAAAAHLPKYKARKTRAWQSLNACSGKQYPSSSIIV
jgi:hypothetical protein